MQNASSVSSPVSFIMLSLALGMEASPIFASKYFLFFTAFVGLNLFQSGFTRVCPLNSILARFGIKDSSCQPNR